MEQLKNLNPIAKVAGAIAAVSLLIFFATGQPVALILGFGLTCAGLSYKYPRWGIWTLLIYLPFAGTVTYWIGGGNVIFNFFKDFFYIPALIALIISCRQQQQPIFISRSLQWPLSLLIASSLVTLIFVNGTAQLATPSNESPLMAGLLGLKILLGYIPLIFCGYYLLHRQTEFFLLTRSHIILALICCGLGVLQYGFLAAGICPSMDGLSGDDLFKATIDYKCLVGGALVYTPSQGIVRLPGTFVSPWHWTWFLIANTFFVVASIFNDPSQRWRTVSILTLITLLLATVISGQNFGLVLILIICGLLLPIFNRKWLLWIGIGAVILSLWMIFPAIFGEKVNSIVGRWAAYPPHDFILEQFRFVLGENFSLLGHGLGSATNAARIFAKTTLIETYYPKLLYEIGLVGCLAFLGVVTALTIVTFKTWRSLQDRRLRGYAIVLWLFLLLISYNTYYYPLDVDPVAVYYWFFAGVLLKLPALDSDNI